MRFLWTSALKDLRHFRRDPASLAIWLLIPVFIITLFSLAFGPGQVSPQGRLLLADEDNTFLSSMIGNAFSQGQLGKMVLVEKVKADEGRRRIHKGGGSAFLLIPKGFSNAFLNNKPARLELLTNPAQRILPGIIQETLSILVEGGFYLQALVGDQVRMMTAGPPPGKSAEQHVIDISRSIHRVMEKLNASIDPPLLELESKVIEEKLTPRVNFGAAMLPGILFMTVLFLGQGMSARVWREREQGVLRRLAVTPARPGLYLGGKLLATGLVLLAVTTAAILLGGWVLDAPLTNWPLAVLWATFSGMAVCLLILLVTMHAPSARSANVAGTLVVFPMMMVGGSLLPFEAMPAGMAAIGRWTPNGMAIVQLSAILTGSVEPARLLTLCAALVIFAAAAGWLVSRRLRRGFLS